MDTCHQKKREREKERRGKMVQQAGAEFATGNLDEYTRYFNYLRTLADLTAMASIVAVQVIGRFGDNFERLTFLELQNYSRD